jgi:hypothetical protein
MNDRCHCTKLSCLGDLVLVICAPLMSYILRVYKYNCEDTRCMFGLEPDLILAVHILLFSCHENLERRVFIHIFDCSLPLLVMICLY